MSAPLPDPRQIYATRAKVVADNRKRGALNTRLPDAGEAMRRNSGAVYPAAASRSSPTFHGLVGLLFELIGKEVTIEFIGTLMDDLTPLENGQAESKTFEDERKQAVDIWAQVQAKKDPNAADIDYLLRKILRAADSFFPRDNGKL